MAIKSKGTGGKRMRAQQAKVKIGQEYSLAEACKLLVDTKSAKFDETVDVAVNLGVDPKKAEQNVRGSVPLPHGLGKNVRVLVFAKGEKAKEAEDAGAELIGGDDLVEKIKGGFMEFDSVVATPDMMVQVGKVGKLLGPRGLMPSPKVGTVTFELSSTIKAIKSGRAEYRVDKAGTVHAAAGKASFGPEKLLENIGALIGSLQKAKPATSKGVYMKEIYLSLTMGPSVKVDPSPYRNV